MIASGKLHERVPAFGGDLHGKVGKVSKILFLGTQQVRLL